MTNPDQNIDLHIGRRLRARRRLLGISQPQLAESVGVKFQQIQKYESGEDRISASRLWGLGIALKVPVDYFYEGLASVRHETQTVDEQGAQQDAQELARSYQRLGEQSRRALLELAQTLSSPSRVD